MKKSHEKKKSFPIHPGKILRKELLKPYRISSKKLAEEIKVETEKIKAVVEERENIDAGLSYRLGLYFGFREDYWLDLQKHYDLECWKDKLERQVKKEIQPYQFNLIKQVLEEKLTKEQQKEKEEFQKKLIAGYKRVAKNKKLQQEVAIWDETLNDAWLRSTKTKENEE